MAEDKLACRLTKRGTGFQTAWPSIPARTGPVARDYASGREIDQRQLRTRAHQVDDRYREERRELEEFFESTSSSGATTVIASPDGRFRLEVAEYADSDRKHAYSRGAVIRTSDGTALADIKRNDDLFWHCWVSHPNGNQYLLCGEDYQGYSCVNLTDGRCHTYFQDEGFAGMGFIWIAAYPSPDGLALAVDGCYWACPYELVFYDFREPDQLPYPEIGRAPQSTHECEGWLDNDTFAYTHQTSTRASDGTEFADLSEVEQAEIRKNPSLRVYRTDRIVAARPRQAASE